MIFYGLRNREDLENVLFPRFIQILDITWIVNPNTKKPRWFFCGQTSDNSTGVYFHFMHLKYCPP